MCTAQLVVYTSD